MRNRMRPISPGEVLYEDFLVPARLSATSFAGVIGVPANRVSMIIAGERAVTADTALRFARALGTTPEFWLNLQQSYDLRLVEQDRETTHAVDAIRPLRLRA
jgi:antitoxin HigA-1